MMIAECLPVPMVGHYYRTIGIKSFSEIYNLSCILNLTNTRLLSKSHRKARYIEWTDVSSEIMAITCASQSLCLRARNLNLNVIDRKKGAQDVTQRSGAVA